MKLLKWSVWEWKQNVLSWQEAAATVRWFQEEQTMMNKHTEFL